LSHKEGLAAEKSTGGLKGRTIIITRAREQAGEFSQLLSSRGARVVEIPTIEIVPPDSWEAADRAIGRLQHYHWLILTSVNGVRFFLTRVREKLGDLTALCDLRICAIGPRTRSAILKEGLAVDFMPTEYIAEAIISEAGEKTWKGTRVLLARAAEAREVVPEQMRRLGAEIDVVPVYRTVCPSVSRTRFQKLLRSGEADVITFTSSSTVRNFVALFPEGEARELLREVAVACIGPVTAGTAREHGLPVSLVPRDYTIPALALAIGEHFPKKL
jgi:uroporphyrinogen III methyltransferase/synthase